jgi:chemotaxis protein methyltransferase CheR
MSRLCVAAPPTCAPQFQHIVFSETIPRGRGALLRTAEPMPRSANDERLADDEHGLLWFVFHEAGLTLSNYRIGTLRRRIPACLRALNANTFSTARRNLQDRPSLLPVALSSLMIGVTSFFRDPAIFAAMEASIFKDLLAGRGGIAAWCAGCSEGAEVYSLAMALDRQQALDRSFLLGTDCRADAIQRARNGLYDGASVGEMEPQLLERYFVPENGMYRIAPRVAARTHWRRADVLALHEPGAWDLIFCRNMAMYFSAEAGHRLWARLESSLRPGGVLVLGKAERPNGTRFLSLVAPCIYRRNRG